MDAAPGDRRGSVNAANLISLGRLLTVPAIVWLILDGFAFWAFWAFVAVGASDALDGFVAKRFGLVTDLGRYLDPIADKVLLVTVFVTLGQAGRLPNWLVILVVSRDVLIIGGAVLAHMRGHGVRLHPLMLSKLNTGAQILLAALALAESAYPALAAATHGSAMPTLVAAVAATTVTSGLIYLIRWTRTAPEHV